jgi:hypothetical protein
LGASFGSRPFFDVRDWGGVASIRLITSSRRRAASASPSSSGSVMRTILPAFDSFPEEGSIIGRLVTGYGELEYELAMCVGWIVEDNDLAMKLMYRLQGENQRLIAADLLGRRNLKNPRLRTTFEQAVSATHECRKIRNQYAHCNWGSDANGLWFVNLEDAAEGSVRFLTAAHNACRTSLPTLRAQEDYFCYVKDCFEYITYGVRRLREEVRTIQGFAAPRSRAAPKLHN